MGDLESVQDVPIQEPPQIDVYKELQELKEANKELLEATRKAQGQARRAEQVALSIQPTVVRPAVDTTDPVESVIDRLDYNDPGSRVVKTALKTLHTTVKEQRAKIDQFEGANIRQAKTSKEQADRAYAGSELIDFAEAAGVDIRTVAKEIDALPTTTMWHEGKKIINAAKKKAPSDTTEEQVVPSETSRYTETRTRTGARPKTWVEIEQGYADGNVSTEQYEAALRARKE